MTYNIYNDISNNIPYYFIRSSKNYFLIPNSHYKTQVSNWDDCIVWSQVVQKDGDSAVLFAIDYKNVTHFDNVLD